MEPIIFPTPEMVDGYVRASKIEELKKLREDIENIRDWVGGTTRYFSEVELNKIFDKRISELKGE